MAYGTSIRINVHALMRAVAVAAVLAFSVTAHAVPPSERPVIEPKALEADVQTAAVRCLPGRSASAVKHLHGV